MYAIVQTKSCRYRVWLTPLHLDKPTGGSGLTRVDVICVEIHWPDDTSGFGFTYALGHGSSTIVAAASELLDLLASAPSGLAEADAERCWDFCYKQLNRVGRGAHYLAMAAIDMAIWDACAKQRGQSLGAALGGTPADISGYGSDGYRPGMAVEEILAQAEVHKARGFSAIKIRIRGQADDAGVIEAVRSGLPAEMALMVDANEKCTLDDAILLADACAGNDVLWLEEPLPSDDFEAYAELSQRSKGTLAVGEHLQAHDAFSRFSTLPTVKYLQPDHAMIGGITQTLRLIRACSTGTTGPQIAPHFLPCLFIHFAGAAPGVVTWLEEFPLLEPLFAGVTPWRGIGQINGLLRVDFLTDTAD